MADPSDEQLREAARARGFRLVKSRRRKPGGDFGRYALADLDSGRECMGFGSGGLTATAEEVLSYLRGGEVASWKRSLIGVVGGEEVKTPERKTTEAEVEVEVEVEKNTKPSARPERGRRASAQTSDRDDTQPPTRKTSESTARASRTRPSTSLRTSGKGSGLHEPEKEHGAAPPEPTIREATRRDAAALAKLIGIPPATLSDRLAAAIRNDEAPLVAELDGLVGALAWTTVATLQQGPQGRITLLLIAENHRRQGLGSRLLAEAEQHLSDAGIEVVELALEIDFDAPTGFLRHAGFTRTTNGYAKALD